MEPIYNWLVEYEHGNDYHCGCCRDTWNETIEFYNLTTSELIEKIALNIAGNDCQVMSIYKRENVNWGDIMPHVRDKEKQILDEREYKKKLEDEEKTKQREVESKEKI